MASFALGVLVSLVGAILWSFTVSGSRVLWNWPGPKADMRGEWMCEVSRNGTQVALQRVSVKRQFRTRFVAEVSAETLHGSPVLLKLDGRFLDANTIQYRHYHTNQSVRWNGTGMLRLSDDRKSAVGAAVDWSPAVEAFAESPTSFEVKIDRSP